MDRTLAAGDRVLLVDAKRRRHLIQLEPGGEFHSHAGVLKHDDLLGQPGPFHHVVFALGDGTLFGLHSFPGADVTTEFDPRRRGLDHVSFGCADREDLAKWAAHLDELGIPHGGIQDAGYGSGVSFRDPDNIALEFFCPPSS